jgi:hypothetical protein
MRFCREGAVAATTLVRGGQCQTIANGCVPRELLAASARKESMLM